MKNNLKNIYLKVNKKPLTLKEASEIKIEQNVIATLSFLSSHTVFFTVKIFLLMERCL